jgi:hypothetical protein
VFFSVDSLYKDSAFCLLLILYINYFITISLFQLVKPSLLQVLKLIRQKTNVREGQLTKNQCKRRTVENAFWLMHS